MKYSKNEKLLLEKKTTGRIVKKANIYAASEVSVNKHMDLEYIDEYSSLIS